MRVFSKLNRAFKLKTNSTICSYRKKPRTIESPKNIISNSNSKLDTRTEGSPPVDQLQVLFVCLFIYFNKRVEVLIWA